MNAVSNRNPPKRSTPSRGLRRRNPRSSRVSGVREDEGGEDVNQLLGLRGRETPTGCATMIGYCEGGEIGRRTRFRS